MPFIVLPLAIVAAIAVCVALLVTVAVLVGLLGVVAPFLPWLLGLALIWALCGGKQRHQERSRQHPASHGRADVPVPPAPARPPRASGPTRPAVAPSTPPRPLRPRSSELPVDVQVKAEQIRRKVEVLLGHAPRFPPFSQDLYLVRQTAAEYLPRTLDAYLALPEGYGDRYVTSTGRTLLQELRGQLDLLDAKLDGIAEALQRQDLDRLLANRTFLETRFDLGDRPARFARDVGTTTEPDAEPEAEAEAEATPDVARTA